MSDDRPTAEPNPPAAPPRAGLTRAVLGQRVRFARDVMIQQVGGESVLLDLQSEEYFGLDPVGTRMMALINEADTVAAALDRVAEEYEVDRATLEADAIALLSDCAAQGLLVIDVP